MAIHELHVAGSLARLIVRASEFSQLWVTTHSQILAGASKEMSGIDLIQLEKRCGETNLVSAQG